MNYKLNRKFILGLSALFVLPMAHAFKCADQTFTITLTQPEGYVYIGPPKIKIEPRVPSGNHINTFLHLHTIDHPFKFYKYWKQSIPFGFTSLEGYGDQTMQLMCSDDSSSRSPSHDSYVPVSNIVKYANQPHGTLESKLKDGDLVKAEGMDPYQMISPTLGPVLVYPPGVRNTLVLYKNKKKHEIHLINAEGGLQKNTKFEYDNLNKIIRTAKGSGVPAASGLPVTELDANGNPSLTNEELELAWYTSTGDFEGKSLKIMNNAVTESSTTYWVTVFENKIIDVTDYSNNPLKSLTKAKCDIKTVTLYRKYKGKYYAIAHSHGYTTEGRIVHAIAKNRIITAEEFESKILKKSEYSHMRTQDCTDSSSSSPTTNEDSTSVPDVPPSSVTCSPLTKSEIKNKFQGAMTLLDIMYNTKKTELGCDINKK
jgi:hypothetical protein